MIQEIRNKIIEIAYKYEGEQEIKGNHGFKNIDFQRKMEGVGFDDGNAWCDLFAELVWSEAYGRFDSTVINSIQKLFTKSAVGSYNKFKRSTKFKTGFKPEPGDLVFWQKYVLNKANWQGHAGIVTKAAQLFFLSMEGNTNSNGGREGIEVAEKKREYDFYKEDGLRLLGFVKPCNI